MHDWRPIASAPKDGSSILGYFPGKGGGFARTDVQTISWSGWGGGVWDNVSGYHISSMPTHWMPLPDPPPLLGPNIVVDPSLPDNCIEIRGATVVRAYVKEGA